MKDTRIKTGKLAGFRSFLRDLVFILNTSGIAHKRLPVRAESDQRKNWQHPSENILKQKIGKVVLYMDDHLAETFTLDELAEEINLSKYQLIRGFQKEKGITPWKFLIQKRIEHVKELLEKGMSPGQAAVESGFYDQSHMNKAFREYTGQTPREYQEKNFRNKN